MWRPNDVTALWPDVLCLYMTYSVQRNYPYAAHDVAIKRRPVIRIMMFYEHEGRETRYSARAD